MSAETEQIKERLNIADVIGEHVKLKRAGQSFKGLCPFHTEKSPSFIVTPARASWHCFGCGEGGDVFTFVQKIEGIDFVAALKLLADRAGVQLPDYKSQGENHRQRLFDVLDAARMFYHEILMNQKAGAQAKQYLLERGVTEDTMKKFSIGYAPHTWGLVQTWLAKKGYTLQEMIAAGIVGAKEGGKPFDRFRGRIMFPIDDMQGRTVAFGGRIVPWHETGNEGKYVNSPETALYEKRRVMYNLSRAKKVLRTLPCIVVEGYMDVVMMVQLGVENVVATSGTAMTEDHVALIKRFTTNMISAFDGDAAGWKATIAATQAALAGGMHVTTITFPDGVDPADIAKDHPEQVASVFSQTRPLMEVLVERLGVGSQPQREQALTALVPLLRLVKNPIEQGMMIEQVAQLLKVPELKISELVAQQEQGGILQAVSPEKELPESTIETPEIKLEQGLLGILLSAPAMREDLFSNISPEYFLDPVCQQVYKELQRSHERDQQFHERASSEIISMMDEAYHSFLTGVEARAEELISTSNNSLEEEARFLMRSLQKRFLRERLASLQEDVSPDALAQFQGLAQRLAAIE
ncbi:MAG TPA: DNA primase [Candidatus Andersenbacteria bacterium]|nr:DNA primase [Candidatus Andersenbacteria bacterium]